MNKLIFTFFVCIVWSKPMVAQLADKVDSRIPFPNECNFVKGKSKLPGFYISNHPVTNRAYIIYMNWLKNCYGDYPEQWYFSWPDFGMVDGSINYYGCEEFVSLVNQAEPLIKDYMFNPKFIDFPVIGMDWQQAYNFCKWLSERYNEYHLVKKGALNDDIIPAYQYCFSTESFLAGQYERPGESLKADRSAMENLIKRKHHLFLPAFRMPTKNELELARKNHAISNELKPYPLPEFLKPWECLLLKDGMLILTDCENADGNEHGISMKDVTQPSLKYSEWNLDSFLDAKGKSAMQIFEMLGQETLIYENEIKSSIDSLGNMPYVLISWKKDLPVIVKAKPVLPSGLDGQGRNFNTFRYVVGLSE